jgi:ribosomal protein S18 acetylase RimI-like enzyme
MTEIRAAAPDDLVTITNLLATPEELFLVYPKGHFPFTIPQAQKLFNERFEFTVLCDGDKIAGFANLYDRQQDEYAFIGNVFIAPEYRCQGLGKLSHCMNHWAFEPIPANSGWIRKIASGY